MNTKHKNAVCVGILLLALMFALKPQTVHAEEPISVTDTKAVLYSTANAKVYAYPDLKEKIVTILSANVPVEVTGVTSNGWFRVNIKGTYYIPGTGLVDQKQAASDYDDAVIKKMIQGTFSFYSGAQLKQIKASDVEDMDDNSYIKYLDSFLKGNSMIDFCIIKDSGLVLKTHYDNKVQTDVNIGQKTMKQYLVDYRNKFVNDSFRGPARSKKNVIQILNRAIRYDVAEFSMIYKHASIGSEETKMKALIEEAVKSIKQEQGVTFTYKLSYEDYETSEGKTSQGWIIDFRKED